MLNALASETAGMIEKNILKIYRQRKGNIKRDSDKDK